MNNNSDENGFTIIESIVVINLSFLLLSMLFGAYLFTVKTTSSLNKKIGKQSEIYSQLYYISDRISHSERSLVKVFNDSTVILLNRNKDIIFRNDEIVITSVFRFNEFDDYEVALISNEKEFVIKNGKSYITPPGTKIPVELPSGELTEIRLNLVKDNKAYEHTIILPVNSVFRFTNI